MNSCPQCHYPVQRARPEDPTKLQCVLCAHIHPNPDTPAGGGFSSYPVVITLLVVTGLICLCVKATAFGVGALLTALVCCAIIELG